MTTMTPQSASMLASEEVVWMAPAPTRDHRAVAKNAGIAARWLRRNPVTHVVSTGSSLALSVLPIASLARARAVYIESATRSRGPSLSGRILTRVPGVRCFTQYEDWADGRWRYAGSVFDSFAIEKTQVPVAIRKVVISLGTSRTYTFRRMVESVRHVLPSDCEAVWQTGATEVNDILPDASANIPSDDLRRAIAEADVVIAHAGTGIALTALSQGKWPILMPRDPSHNEHVDDHQYQIAHALSDRGLALVRTPDELTRQDLLYAAAHRATTPRHAAPLDVW